MKNNMDIKTYVKQVEWTLIDYDWVYGSQCVDLIKNYTATVLNIRLWTFWGSARSGWENKSNTFPEDIWEKIVNNFSDKDQIPKEWDIVFWNTGKYWHVAIVLDAYGNAIEVLEQNVGNGNWIGQDDAIEVNTKSYHDILGWYKLKENNQDIIKKLSVKVTKLTIENTKLKNTIKKVKILIGE